MYLPIDPIERAAAHVACARYSKMQPEQKAFADHLLSSWRCREFFSGRAITCEGNYHIPIIRTAIRLTVERRP